MAQQIQIRRDTSTNWSSANPILAQGEMGLELDTLKVKFGDGTTAWNSLPYFANRVKDATDVSLTSLASGNILITSNASIFINYSLSSLIYNLALSSLGSLAYLSSIDYTSTYLTNKPSLSSLAYLSSIDYTSTYLTNKPSLGSLAPLNELAYDSLISRPSLGSVAFANNVVSPLNLSGVTLSLSLPSLIHNDLGLLQGGTASEYFHLTDAEYQVVQATSGTNSGDVTVVDSDTIQFLLTGQEITADVIEGGILHNNLGGLTTGDPHTQYALLAGRSGGQTLHGGTAANNLLILRGTSANGNTATSNAIRFGVGNGGGTYAFDLRHNGTIAQTVNTSTNADGYTLSQTITGTTGDNIGALFNITDSAGGTKTDYAFRAVLNYTGGTGTTLTGIQATSNQIKVLNGGTVTNGEVLTANMEVTNNSIVTNANLIKVFSPTVNTGGTITNLTGISLPNLTQGTNNFSIYSEGGVMYHAGNVGIGTNNPTVPLDVVGDIRTSSEFLSSNGTNTAPSYTFTNDNNTGMYNITADTLGFTTGGTERIRIASDGKVGIGRTPTTYQFELQGSMQAYGGLYATEDVYARQAYMAASLDSATVPAYSWDDDTDTGMYNSSADVIGFSTGGTARLFISSAGLLNNIVGTAAAPSYSFNADNNLGIFRAGADILGFTTNGVEKLRITATGNVDISSTTGALILSQLTSTQRDALTGIVNGMIIYNTTTLTVQARVNNAWVNL